MANLPISQNLRHLRNFSRVQKSFIFNWKSISKSKDNVKVISISEDIKTEKYVFVGMTPLSHIK